MKKSLMLIGLILVFSLGFLGCNEKYKTEENISIDKSTNNEVTTANKTEYNDPQKTANIEDLLGEINIRAKEGMILNVDFKARDDSFDNIETHWGKAYKREFIEEAKGTYVTYLEKNTVFGMNKGEMIFEIRSFAKKIKEISLKDIVSFYGQPEYEALLKNDERIVGYKVSNDFKVEFVLKNSKGKSDEQFVDHYGVFYPKGTINNMSGDRGRDW